MAAKDDRQAVKKLQKSYFDVLGLCCSSEVPLVENILNSLEGVKEYSVIFPTRTVIVVHDALLVSQLQIVKALNHARLEANVRVYGATNYEKRWPSPYAVGSGLLLLLSFLKYVYPPLRWLAIGSVAIGIIPIFLKGVASVRNLRLDTNIIVLVAVIGALCMSDYTEAGTIVFLFAVAEWLEARAGHKAQAVMSSLMRIAPQKAVIAETGEEVDVDEVKLNTVLAVKAGEVIPIDGVVVGGKCEVDEKTLTGESFPVLKDKDSTVWAGTINLNGYVSVKTTALAEDCVVAKMTKLVEEAQNSKSNTQRFIDKCAQYYTPAVIITSASLAIVPLAFNVHNRDHWFHLALVVLVSACPCALILSTPVATFCALTKAATAGLLIKGGDYLETLAKIKVMAFDKTGTLTRGEFVVNDFESLSHDVSTDTLICWVSSIESKSSHPMAAALVDYGRSLSLESKPQNVEEFQNYPGEGIHGRIDGKSIYIGNRKIGLRAGSGTVPTIEANKARGQTIGYVYCEAKLAGIFSLSDVCRTGVREAIKELKLLSIKTAMLTGDGQSAATHTQEQLGNALDTVHSELLPKDKARIIESFKKDGPTAMIGDGMNDAPALATADIGISMGVSGSALTTETGQVILMSNDLGKVPKAIQLARKAHRKVIENVILSIMTKGAILALAFAGHPIVWAAVLADVGTCLLVICNSMLLLKGTSNHSGKCCKSSSTSHGNKHVNNHSSHNHKHCCSDKNVANIGDPEGCKSGHLCFKPCKTSKCSDSTERKNDSIGECRFKETKHCNDGGCQVDNHDLEANILPKNCCSDHHDSSICTRKEEAVQAKCRKDRRHNAAKGEDFCCQTLTQQGVANYCSHSNNSTQCQGLTDSSNPFSNHCCKDRVKNKINEESVAVTRESCCSDQHQHLVLHHDLPKCCKDQSDPFQTAIDLHPAAGHIDTTTNHACLSLEKREIGGCCKSYMKECRDQHERLQNSGFGGGLSEIVTE